MSKDMENFFGDDWQEKVKCSKPTTQQYVDQMHYMWQHEPELLVAHTYTWYIGDLSGSQILKKVTQQILKLLSRGEGIQFCPTDNAQQFKQFYQVKMNALDLDLKTKEKIVKEANVQIFNELNKAGSLLARGSQNGELLIHDGKGDVHKCPYYAAQQGAHGGSACPFKNVMAKLSDNELSQTQSVVLR